jgi:hypothetical protein
MLSRRACEARRCEVACEACDSERLGLEGRGGAGADMFVVGTPPCCISPLIRAAILSLSADWCMLWVGGGTAKAPFEWLFARSRLCSCFGGAVAERWSGGCECAGAVVVVVCVMSWGGGMAPRALVRPPRFGIVTSLLLGKATLTAE